jgi:hypothetical protein
VGRGRSAWRPIPTWGCGRCRPTRVVAQSSCHTDWMADLPVDQDLAGVDRSGRLMRRLEKLVLLFLRAKFSEAGGIWEFQLLLLALERDTQADIGRLSGTRAARRQNADTLAYLTVLRWNARRLGDALAWLVLAASTRRWGCTNRSGTGIAVDPSAPLSASGCRLLATAAGSGFRTAGARAAAGGVAAGSFSSGCLPVAANAWPAEVMVAVQRPARRLASTRPRSRKA